MKTGTTPRRYFLSSDESGNKYVIPCDKERAWEHWWEMVHMHCCPAVPEWAIRVDVIRLTFTDPQDS
jgi:hypothetical protein